MTSLWKRIAKKVTNRFSYKSNVMSLQDKLTSEWRLINDENSRIRNDNRQLTLEIRHQQDEYRRLIGELSCYRPWLVFCDDAEKINPFPSMMTAEESVYLHWLARHHYEGEGEIIDGGPLLGGSTYALASGLSKNTIVSSKSKRIHSYDIFRYHNFYMAGLIASGDLEDGDSLLPFFLANTHEYEDHIEVHAGDILDELRWDGRPIEILFVDVAKEWAINDLIVQQCFDSLIPNRSIVVHQDYFHFHCFWIHLCMQYFKDYFKVIDSPQGGTLCFLLVKEIPLSVLRRYLEEPLGKEAALDLFDEAILPFKGIRKLKVMTAKMRCLVHYNDIEAAARLAIEIRNSHEWDASMDFWIDNYWDDVLYDLVEAQIGLPVELLFPGIQDTGHIVGMSRRFNVIRHEDTLYAVPSTIKSFDPENVSHRERPDVFRAETEHQLRYLIGERIRMLPG